MPSYLGTSGSAVAMYPGDQVIVLNAESPAANARSISVAPSRQPIDGHVLFAFEFSAAPTASAFSVQGAMVDTPGAYETLYQTTTSQLQSYEDDGVWAYYSILCASASGEPVTVTVRH